MVPTNLSHQLCLQHVEQHPSVVSRCISTPQVLNAALFSTAVDEEAPLAAFTGAVTGRQKLAAEGQQLGHPLLLRGRPRH